MFKIGVLVSGGGTNLQSLIDRIEDGFIPAEIVTVVSSNKNAFALERAQKHGIHSAYIGKRAFESPEAFEDALIAHFKAFHVDLIVLAGFLVILSERFITAFDGQIINVHPSLIPSFCGQGFYGLKVHEAALEKGVKVTGATVHFVVAEADAGPIILQKSVEVLDGDTPETLQKRVMAEAEQVILPKAVKLLAEKNTLG